jgi:hypothetical protein
MARVLAVSLLLAVSTYAAAVFEPLGPNKPCAMDHGQPCEVDKFVATTLIHEDEAVRVWNMTLAPGQMTSLHRHDYDYYFVVIEPAQLEVWGEDGSRLFDFRAEGTMGFTVQGDWLIPSVSLPRDVPRVHAAKNISPNTYYEILFETKSRRPTGGHRILSQDERPL